MNQYEEMYKHLLNFTALHGEVKPSRGDTDTISLFSQSIACDISKGFPMLTGKQMFWKNVEHEAKWMLTGQTNTKYLRENGVKIWDNWANDKGDLGLIYGHQMRAFNNEVDQIQNVIKSLKSDPNGRRHMVNLWNPQQLHEMALPPCHYAFTFYALNGKLSVDVQMRSGDLFVGIPYDVALYSLILTIIANEVGLTPHMVNINITDCHIYVDHLPMVKKYLTMDTHDLPTLKYEGSFDDLLNAKCELLDYKCGKFLKVPINI